MLYYFYIIKNGGFMKENYYEILEVSTKASPEIVKKAYITLVKKYHPDLQDDSKKEEYENKLKKINEAYEVLSDETKRKKYDLELENLRHIQSEQSNLRNAGNCSPSVKKTNNINSDANEQYSNLNNTNSNYENAYNEDLLKKQKNLQQELEYQKQLEYARKKAYHDAYIQDLKNRGYKIRYKKTFSDYVRSGISIMLTVFVLFLLFQIPFVKNFIYNLYLDNSLLQLIINPLINAFKNFNLL